MKMRQLRDWRTAGTWVLCLQVRHAMQVFAITCSAEFDTQRSYSLETPYIIRVEIPMVACAPFAMAVIAIVLQRCHCDGSLETTASSDTSVYFYIMALMSLVGTLTTVNLALTCLKKTMTIREKSESPPLQVPTTEGRRKNTTDLATPREVFVARGSDCFHIDCGHLKRKGATFTKLRLCSDCAAKRRLV